MQCNVMRRKLKKQEVVIKAIAELKIASRSEEHTSELQSH